MAKKSIPVKLVFDDWFSNNKSIYNSELGVKLSMGDLHSGTTFECELIIEGDVGNEMVNAMEDHQAFPSFLVLYNKDMKDYKNTLEENEKLKKYIEELEERNNDLTNEITFLEFCKIDDERER